MSITIVIINPRQEMMLGCGWRKKWSREFEDFEKEGVEIGPLRHRVGSSAVEACDQVLQISNNRDLKQRYATRWALCLLSSCRHEPKSEVNQRVCIWNNRVHLCFLFVYVLYYGCDWSHHSYTTYISIYMYIFAVKSMMLAQSLRRREKRKTLHSTSRK